MGYTQRSLTEYLRDYHLLNSGSAAAVSCSITDSTRVKISFFIIPHTAVLGRELFSEPVSSLAKRS